MSPVSSSAGPLTTDRPPAENSGAKLIDNATPHLRQKHDRTADHRQRVQGCLVLFVETTDGRYRRRPFLTLAAADRACRRAEQSGHVASVVVARLEPVAVIA
jgi:hypothetical protein